MKVAGMLGRNPVYTYHLYVTQSEIMIVSVLPSVVSFSLFTLTH